MSIRKAFLPEINEIKKFYNDAGFDAFVKRYAKVEVFLGPSDSIDFINEKLEEYYSNDKKEIPTNPELEKLKELVGRSV